MENLWNDILENDVYHVGTFGFLYLPLTTENWELLKKHNVLEKAVQFKELDSNKLWFFIGE